MLAISPILRAVVVVQIVRRAGNYAVTRPAREMLFTRVDRETRFKAKPVIDIVAYRGRHADGLVIHRANPRVGFGVGGSCHGGCRYRRARSLVGIYLGRWFERDDVELG